jgi:hypothetical protein
MAASNAPPPPVRPALRETPVVLFHDEHMTVTLEEGGALVRQTRTARQFDDVAQLVRTYDEVCRILDRLGRGGRSFLSDLRRAPGRNGPAFEAAMHKILPHLLGGFDRCATLVATAAGSLQVRRLIREGGLERMVSTDELELVRYLLKLDPSGGG